MTQPIVENTKCYEDNSEMQPIKLIYLTTWWNQLQWIGTKQQIWKQCYSIASAQLNFWTQPQRISCTDYFHASTPRKTHHRPTSVLFLTLSLFFYFFYFYRTPRLSSLFPTESYALHQNSSETSFRPQDPTPTSNKNIIVIISEIISFLITIHYVSLL